MAGVLGRDGQSEDAPDMYGGFEKALKYMSWREDAVKVVIHIADSPANSRHTGPEVKNGEKL